MTDQQSDDAHLTPSDDQQVIIESDEYPMRVLAGAGTGKTFTMVRKIERLIDGQGVDPDRILALTFTNKAADSMQTKLGEKIGSRGYDIDAYTYHSICHRLLKEYAYHTGLDPDLEVASEADTFELVLRVLDEIDYQFISPAVYADESYGSGAETKLTEFISAMKSDGTAPEELDAFLGDAETLRNLQQLIDRITDSADTHLRYNWRKITADRLATLNAGLAEFQTDLQELRAELGAAPVEEDVETFLAAYLAVVERLQTYFTTNEDRIIDGELTPAFKLPAFLFGAYASAPSGLPELGFTLTGELESFVDLACEAYDLTQAYDAYERGLHADSLVDFDDLVLETLELLSDPTRHQEIAGQWDYVFCDEFQDTDSIQFDLVTQLADNGNLFVVGDDDQAIYEWRGANIENIGRRLSDTYPALTDQSLEENYRSKQPILELANNAIDRLEGRSSDKELEATGANRGVTDGVATVSGFEDETEQADRLTRVLRDLTSEHPELTDEAYEFGDVAILVRKKRHANAITDQLRDAGIPYEFTDGNSEISVGLETVLSFLDAVADPSAEVSLNRVLTMRYRLHDRDLRTLNASEQPLAEALIEISDDKLYEPARVNAARSDLIELWEKCETHSAKSLYAELKTTTDIQWYLSEHERRNLGMIDRAVEAVADRSVSPALTPGFIDTVRRYVAADESLSMPTDQSEKATGAVNIMTVHKSKGLDFPVVMLPSLSASEWDPNRDRQSFDALASYASREASPLDSDLLARDLQESRRVFHVAVTRAEDQLVLFGEGDPTETDSEDLPLSAYREVLPPSLPYKIGAVEFPIWVDVLDSLPSSAEDWSDRVLELPRPAENALIGTTDGQQRQTELRNRVLDLARQAATGGLTEYDPGQVGIRVSSLDMQETTSIKREHSYTSVESVGTCRRQHYLDYVVRAFDDRPGWGTTVGEAATTGSGSIRNRGVLFHEVAEYAAKNGLKTRDEWLRCCEELARKQDLEHVVSEVTACINRFFETPASAWTVLAAERPFTIDIEGYELTGLIDAICEKPDGSVVVLDYKATKTKRDLEHSTQLLLYLRACESILERSVDEAGYVYVGEVGPSVETRTFSDTDLDRFTEEVVDILEMAEQSSYTEYTAGDHCRYCSHKSLPCSEYTE